MSGVSVEHPRPSAEPGRPEGDRLASLFERFLAVRGMTERLATPLSAEDRCLQSMPEASPTKWHLAHTTWFFETFVLSEASAGYLPFDPAFGYLFNSYYESVGPRHSRARRGLLSRPSCDEVTAYRRKIDEELGRLLATGALPEPFVSIVEVGLNHEQQHQELLLTDIKHAFSLNPMSPAYAPPVPTAASNAASTTEASRPLDFVRLEGGLTELGAPGEGFSYDNERPRHRVWLEPFELATRPITCGEYLEFIEAGGYRDPRWWLSDGWDWLQREGISAPGYWRADGHTWRIFTLRGERPLAEHEPVCHVSFYEADAFARWRGVRLPSEAEWEHAATAAGAIAPAGVGAIEGSLGAPSCAREPAGFLEDGRLHPGVMTAEPGLPGQLLGGVWEWTASPYVGYPGFRPEAGALGEYNGKFMCDQWVLRGGSCLTPASHIRASYRNFMGAGARWQMSGLRLAR